MGCRNLHLTGNLGKRKELSVRAHPRLSRSGPTVPGMDSQGSFIGNILEPLEKKIPGATPWRSWVSSSGLGLQNECPGWFRCAFRFETSVLRTVTTGYENRDGTHLPQGRLGTWQASEMPQREVTSSPHYAFLRSFPSKYRMDRSPHCQSLY